MKGLVTETKGRFVTVHIVRKEACGECRACLSGMMENDMDIEAQNLCEAEVGDWVELELQDNAFMHAVLIDPRQCHLPDSVKTSTQHHRCPLYHGFPQHTQAPPVFSSINFAKSSKSASEMV